MPRQNRISISGVDQRQRQEISKEDPPKVVRNPQIGGLFNLENVCEVRVWFRDTRHNLDWYIPIGLTAYQKFTKIELVREEVETIN